MFPANMFEVLACRAGSIKDVEASPPPLKMEPSFFPEGDMETAVFPTPRCGYLSGQVLGMIP